MNDFPMAGPPRQLLIKDLLDRPRTWSPEQRILYRDLFDGTYAQFEERVRRLANVLTHLGVQAGDRVGVLDWDSHRYLELFFAVPMVGAVLHTVNTRLSPDQTWFTIHHAEDKVLFVHADFAALLPPFSGNLPLVEARVLLTDDGREPASAVTFAGEYEALLAAASPVFEFPDLDENMVATLFYTTGTTGDPKGVFFSHRQLVLHTLSNGLMLAAFRRPFGLDGEDVYMPLTPMFHVHAWGVPYVATLLGMKQVYPGRYEPQLLLDMIVRHRVSFSHCVPTILQMLLHHPASRRTDLTGLKLVIGGAALPVGLAQEAMDRGIRIMGGYGMSETCPIVACSHLKPSAEPLDREAELDVITRTGFPSLLVRAVIVDPDGKALPPGKDHVGELALQAPWLTTGYFRSEEKSRELWKNGWLRTGDVAYMDPDGYIRITDRLKDVIKIGGEWISSLELEQAFSRHEAVKEVAVVGLPDPKWGERPRADVVLRDAFKGKVGARDLAHFLHGFIDQGHLHKRAILTEIRFLDALPRTSVGKIDKRALR